MNILTPSTENIKKAGLALKNGLLVGMPTETVYGLAGNAFDSTALASIFTAKERPFFDPLIIHIADMEILHSLVNFSKITIDHNLIFSLLESFWPGPLTVVFPKKEIVPKIATSGLDSVAIRFPNHPVALALIKESTQALAAPSANLFGHLSPTTAYHVQEQLGTKIKYIIDAGPCTIGLESTVLDITGDIPQILRPGGLSLEAIQKILPNTQVFDRTTTSPKAPGQLQSHYSPQKPLYLVESGKLNLSKPKQDAIALCFSRESTSSVLPSEFKQVLYLSESGSCTEAASALFSLLHECDNSPYNEIWAERVPNEGIGVAINDRLYKASRK